MYHPQPRSNGQPVTISNPSQPTPPATWEDWQAVATWVPAGAVPATLNDLPVAAQRARRGAIDWTGYAQGRDSEDPPFQVPSGFKAAAGAVVVEPHGRVWVVHPTNGFAGYKATFPKGTVSPGANLRETAVREVFEETGLLVEPFAFLADSQRSLSYTRYYLARRKAGSPAEMGWESQAVSLVPLTQLPAFLNRSIDRVIAQRLLAIEGQWGEWFGGTGVRLDGHKVATRYSWQRQPLPPQQQTLRVAIRLTAQQADRVRQGFIPVEQEQHWFAYFEDGILYQHRSWTGNLIYVTPFIPDGAGLRATHTRVNRDPRQNAETDEGAMRRAVEQLVLSLAEAPPNEALTDHFAACLARTLVPNYLGAPATVVREVGGFLDKVVGNWLTVHLGADGPGISHQEVQLAMQQQIRIFAGLDPDYTVIGTWNSAVELGAAVVRYFELDAAYCAGESLPFILQEGLAALSLACTALLKAGVAQDLDLDQEILPRLQALAQFASTVLMGTQGVFYPGKTLQDFSRISPNTSP